MTTHTGGEDTAWAVQMIAWIGDPDATEDRLDEIEKFWGEGTTFREAVAQAMLHNGAPLSHAPKPPPTPDHPDTIALRAWQEAFGTSQLTHAIARLEAAERKPAPPTPLRLDPERLLAIAEEIGGDCPGVTAPPTPAGETPRMTLKGSLHSTATAIWEKAFQEYCDGNGDQSAHERAIHALEIAFCDLLEREEKELAAAKQEVEGLRHAIEQQYPQRLCKEHQEELTDLRAQLAALQFKINNSESDQRHISNLKAALQSNPEAAVPPKPPINYLEAASQRIAKTAPPPHPTAALRIAAQMVRETGAVEALEELLPRYAEMFMALNLGNPAADSVPYQEGHAALAKLKALTGEAR